MIDYNVEFTKGVLFIRLFGLLNKFNEINIENDLYEIIRDGGIRFLVFNIEELEIEDDVSLFKNLEDVVKQNDGKMLLCGNNDANIYDYEIFSDELAALKELSIC